VCAGALKGRALEAIRTWMSTGRQGKTMIAFLRRLSMHYGIYRRYPLARFSALRNAWRIARV
jgi:hypothetical protein